MSDGHFRNVPVTDIGDALRQAIIFSQSGDDAYLACAEYTSPANRKAANVSGACCFFLDLDCGAAKAEAGNGYADIHLAQAAIDEFCHDIDLPFPTHLVHSGGGLHAYWVTSEFMCREIWQIYAGQLKALCKAIGLLADPSRTSDIASILRVPGTLNYKYKPPREVRLVRASDEYIDRDLMLERIDAAHHRLCSVGAASPDSARGATSGHPAKPFDGPVDIERLASALKALDPDCSDDEWKLRRLAPMARAAQANPELAAQLKELATSWSSGELRGRPAAKWSMPGASNGIAGKAAFEKSWNRFSRETGRDGCTTFGTIYHDAKEAGWTEPLETFRVINPLPRSSPTQALLDFLDALIEKVKGGDVGAPLEPDNAAFLSGLSRAEYQRARKRIKDANKGVSLSALDAEVKAASNDADTAPTHHAYAADLIDGLTVDGFTPVTHAGCLHVADDQIWVRKDHELLARLVAEAHDGKKNCTRRSDYIGIAQHAMSLAGDDSFFDDAPIGLACADGFHRLVGNEITVEPLTPEHRQRVLLDFSPRDQKTLLFDAFLHETFQSTTPGEERQQTDLVQEIAGAILLGIMHHYQKATLFYDPYGRAGKGTLERILRTLVPPRFVTAVSPFDWDKPYFIFTLAGARLNVVGELPDNESIPAANFKSVTGGDLLTGRHPSHRPISFKNEAAHLFMSNHLINSRDQSEAFFSRWLIVEFPNSRLRTGLPLDPNTAQRIIDSEMPGIAHWALQGAKRLLRNNGFTTSSAHERLMQKWRRGNSSLEEFIHECGDLAVGHSVWRSKFYSVYKAWCGENGRRPFAKGRIKELLEHNVGLGISLGSERGNEVFRGVQLKPDVVFSDF
ncbi:MAG: phage/plasmid primase, P4 family [Nitrospirota bacterium]